MCALILEGNPSNVTYVDYVFTMGRINGRDKRFDRIKPFKFHVIFNKPFTRQINSYVCIANLSTALFQRVDAASCGIIVTDLPMCRNKQVDDHSIFFIHTLYRGSNCTL